MRYCLLCLLILFTACSDPLAKNPILSEAYKLKKMSVPKHPVKTGEWRERYTEVHEPLQAYLNKNPPRPSIQKSKLYVVQLGTFDATGKQIFDDTKNYLKAFFQIEVAELSPLNINAIPNIQTRQNSFGLQLNTHTIIDSLLPAIMPEDAFAVIAFSLYDLYPDEGWNFVFGQASLERRVGVWSMARLGDYHVNDSLYALCRQRTMNVAAHETGHIIGIKHCVKYECCMNGSISLSESDQQPAWLCWECLAKVCLNRQVHPEVHINDLLHFHKRISHNKKQIEHYTSALALLKQ